MPKFLVILLTSFFLSSEQYRSELEQYIVDFLDPINKTKSYQNRRAEALEIVPPVLKYSKRYNIDPLRVAVILEFESSWQQNVIGSRGEIGPLQVMPRFFKRVFSLETLDDKIHAGVWWLKVASDRCKGDIVQSYNYYGVVTCKPVRKFAKWRARKYHRAVKKYRK